MSTAAWQLPAGCRLITSSSLQLWTGSIPVLSFHLVRRIFSSETAVQSASFSDRIRGNPDQSELATETQSMIWQNEFQGAGILISFSL
jgi:hypothetical protein